MPWLSFLVYLLLIPNLALSEVFDSSVEKEGSQTTSDSQLQMAQSGRCPISMPRMTSPVVFQSVEAPQIEPMNEQDPLPYNDYDLVKGKPAGVLIYLREEQMHSRHNFILFLKIKGDRGFVSKCFHSPFDYVMRSGNQTSCYFNRRHLRNEGYYKFFPLPMKGSFLDRVGTFTITATIYPEGYSNNPNCLKNKRTFRIKVVETGILNLAFTRIYGGRNCYESYDSRTGLYDPDTGYDPVSYRVVEDFVDSDEVRFFMESMFPVKGVSSDAIEYTWRGQDYNYVKGECSNKQALDSPAKKDTEGLLADIDNLEQTREELSYSKIIAIVPESYFVFHGHGEGKNQVTPAGLTIRPRRKKRYEDQLWSWLNRFVPPKIVGGSWNVIFIRSNEVDEGTVSHELAHVLGQGRELYDKGELCRHFRADKPVFCHKEKFIPMFLHTGIGSKGQFWQLMLEDRYTFMSNQEDIKEQWIDRDTYQKLLWTLSKYGSVIQPEVDLRKELSSLREREEKIIVSGFYNKEQNIFVAPKIKISPTKIVTPSFDEVTEDNISFVTFQLKEQDTILQEIKRPVFEMEMELFYKSSFPVTRPFDFSHALAAFNCPANHRERNLHVFVLDPGGSVIYSFPVPEEATENKIRKQSGM